MSQTKRRFNDNEHLKYDWEPIRRLADGTRSSREIAALTGYTVSLVQKVIWRENLPRRKKGHRYTPEEKKRFNATLKDIEQDFEDIKAAYLETIRTGSAEGLQQELREKLKKRKIRIYDKQEKTPA